tara:strand:- start:701 stop:1345 length:645 start_codon:yes stop_codon:yes gene_type:complete
MAIGLGALVGPAMEIFGASRIRGEIMDNFRGAQAQVRQDNANLRGFEFTNEYRDDENLLEDVTIDRTSYDAQMQGIDRSGAQALDALVQSGVGGAGAAQAIIDSVTKNQGIVQGEAAKKQEAINLAAAQAGMQLQYQDSTAADDMQLRQFSKLQQDANRSRYQLAGAEAAARQNTMALVGGIGDAFNAMGSFNFGAGGKSGIGKALGSIFGRTG